MLADKSDPFIEPGTIIPFEQTIGVNSLKLKFAEPHVSGNIKLIMMLFCSIV